MRLYKEISIYDCILMFVKFGSQADLMKFKGEDTLIWQY